MNEPGVLRIAFLLPWIASAASAASGVEAGTAGLDDSAIEQILHEGKVVKSVDVGSGVTHPKRVWFEYGDVTLSAIFKDVDIKKRGFTRFASGNRELNFSDSYRYERAAYLVDRELGLGMVPVTVIRSVSRTRGSVTQWILNSITEQQRVAQGLRPADMLDLIYQWADMRLFDALIYNTDRHAGNQLYSLEDWRLKLIDHSRAFRTQDTLPEDFENRPLTVTRSTYLRLEELNEHSLKTLLKKTLSVAQIESLLIRRDLILAKLESDLLEVGEASVFRQKTRVEQPD